MVAENDIDDTTCNSLQPYQVRLINKRLNSIGLPTWGSKHSDSDDAYTKCLGDAIGIALVADNAKPNERPLNLATPEHFIGGQL